MATSLTLGQLWRQTAIDGRASINFSIDISLDSVPLGGTLTQLMPLPLIGANQGMILEDVWVGALINSITGAPGPFEVEFNAYEVYGIFARDFEIAHIKKSEMQTLASGHLEMAPPIISSVYVNKWPIPFVPIHTIRVNVIGITAPYNVGNSLTVQMGFSARFIECARDLGT